ncbi:hypothetical protein Pen02_81090 [Plantactinospora endophytica]|uniref:CHAT domain-containing protein n=2 Tax=Plantactinospora endophytica TaxID=673535 RepID=A0ABQ4EEM3_9ACTN|nr:hypothetical protein Pen02_81090 [Plantactinospora endophytica]
MPTTPARDGTQPADLTGTAAEALTIAGRFPHATTLLGPAATVEQVRTDLTGAAWAHFACHGTSEPGASFRSRMLLFDGDLDVRQISGLRLRAAELAYLSACSTAQGGLAAADEVITLASAFQLAGFRHVIGSLWPVDDAISVDTTRLFYDELLDFETTENAARILNHVTKVRRAVCPNDPHLWTQLIHVGP